MTIVKRPFLEVFEDASKGNKKTPQREFLEHGQFPVVDQGQGLIAGYINDPDRLCKAKPPVIIFGDHTRAIKYVDFEFAMGADGTKVLKPKIESDVKYLYHALSFINLPSAGYSRHFKFLKELSIPLPPLHEQKRIATILDAADALRAKRRESIAQLDALLQSTFIDLFGDPIKNPYGWKVGKVGDLLDSVNYGTSKKADESKGRYPILRMGNITYEGGWNFSSLKYIDLDEKEARKYLVNKGDILFNRTNSKELVGKTAVYRLGEPMAFAGYLVRAKTRSHADPEYISSYMNTPQTKKRLAAMCKSIVGMANINAKEFQAIPIPIPPLERQLKFSTIVSRVEEEKETLKSHLDILDSLFYSLQQKAFSGEL